MSMTAIKNPLLNTKTIGELVSQGYVPFIELDSTSATLALEQRFPIHIRIDLVRTEKS